MTTSHISTLGWTLTEWRVAYLSGLTPDDLLTSLRDTMMQRQINTPDHAWISLVNDKQLEQQLEALAKRLDALSGDIAALPLYGVPCAIKDNIDCINFETTAACPSYTYQPSNDAQAVTLLKQAGAIIIGKTNLDQFATGLVGTRSPYGQVKNPFDNTRISGGSSSGSAVVVAQGLVPFSLGTDTAGSGRIPAGFNHIVGLKPSKGMISNRGVIPACRSLDCVSIFAQNIEDADSILTILAEYDHDDPYSRHWQPPIKTNTMRLAVPSNAQWFGDHIQAHAFEKAKQNWQELGYQLVSIDFTPFFEMAALLYQGPWIAERYAAVGNFVEQNLTDIDATVKSIITGGKTDCSGSNLGSAVDCFNAEYRRMALNRQIHAIMTTVDALLVPTAPCFPTTDSVKEKPIEINSQLGTYTNFVNLADLCAIAVPSQARSDGLPFGITLISNAFSETMLTKIAMHWQHYIQQPSAPTVLGIKHEKMVDLAVVGAHLTGMPLNHQLTSRGASFIQQTLTSANYELYALSGTSPPKPGLVRVAEKGQSIIVEIWRLTESAFGQFVSEIPRPLGIGTLELADGRFINGFICEPEAIANATNISAFGGWRTYIESINTNKK